MQEIIKLKKKPQITHNLILGEHLIYYFTVVYNGKSTSYHNILYVWEKKKCSIDNWTMIKLYNDKFIIQLHHNTLIL